MSSADLGSPRSVQARTRRVFSKSLVQGVHIAVKEAKHAVVETIWICNTLDLPKNLTRHEEWHPLFGIVGDDS